MIQQNITKLASIAIRTTAAQRVNPVSDGSSLLHWLTSTSTKSTATQTSNSVLAAAAALHSRETLAGTSQGAAQYSADLSAVSGPDSEVDGSFPNRRFGTITGPHPLHLPRYACPQQELLR